eukprot:1151195-Pelagomonas_calceolata.AAC.3
MPGERSEEGNAHTYTHAAGLTQVLDTQEVEDEQEDEDQTPQEFVEDDGEEDEEEVSQVVA